MNIGQFMLMSSQPNLTTQTKTTISGTDGPKGQFDQLLMSLEEEILDSEDIVVNNKVAKEELILIDKLAELNDEFESFEKYLEQIPVEKLDEVIEMIVLKINSSEFLNTLDKYIDFEYYNDGTDFLKEYEDESPSDIASNIITQLIQLLPNLKENLSLNQNISSNSVLVKNDFFHLLNQDIKQLNITVNKNENFNEKVNITSFISKLVNQLNLVDPTATRTKINSFQLDGFINKFGEKSNNLSNVLLTNGDLSQPMNKTQQLVIHIGESQSKQGQQQQFIRQFQEMISRGTFSNLNNGMQQLTIKLFPEHLGRLDIQLTQMNGVMTARILASSTAARELIESQIHQLRQAFSQQQIQVERIEISHQNQQQLGQTDKDEQQKNNKDQKDDNKQSDDDENNDSFEEELKQFSINEEV
ncbi:flagellar hook-length control protein FliK [Bacillus sp. FJAT-45350]|uniref:flagellar hook-length control protein FliK n=1 Tax=Bacillus sp. FJAT-45350 TaxID=2011014 RepID=UPI000BB75DD8|nr:flagellar hook-length control protein FliK [Bacillus sp. FJAT-45350]